MRGYLFAGLICLLFACNPTEKNAPLFEQLDSAKTGIKFINEVKNTKDFNIFSYRNFYNGGGVAIGDINNDGLADVFMTRNSGPNKLYLNKGDFQFEDISDKAGVTGTKAWSTGVVMVDINHDGLLDIYVCNAGYVEGDDQTNELFINNGNLSFSEKAADYQLNEDGYTTHAAFFDYDLDGDLDVYMLNNSFIPVNTLNFQNKRELRAKDWPVKDFLKGGGDKLLRNDDGKFNDVSEEAGIYGSLIGFGLGITIGDMNGDNWPDMYVSNDFFERDYLYVNQKDGTFKEEIKDYMQHLSLASMGADMADINNDGYPEIFVTEMLPDDEYRLKTITDFENYNSYQLKLKRDFYHQYMHNTLQLNNKDQSFSEISWYAGVSASDWSWGALLFDVDNDGYRDIYVCNGVYQDVTDQDFINFFANDLAQKMALKGEKEEMEKVIERMPSNPQVNKLFRNNQDLTFSDQGQAWGVNTPSFSNGAAYGDLDNDGDLDLIVNNLGMEAFVYRNHSDRDFNHHYLSIQLRGSKKNTFAIGAKVTLHCGDQKISAQNIPTRGFQSSIDYKLNFGLGKRTQVDSLEIIWPDQKKSLIPLPPVDTLLEIAYDQSAKSLPSIALSKKEDPIFEEVPSSFKPGEEDLFIDFYQEGLVMRMLSREGPAMAKGDVNGDGLEDVFIGAAAGHLSMLYIQTPTGFREVEDPGFGRNLGNEDTAAAFFDADGDGDLDLFIGAGGNHKPARSREMQDRIWYNDGKGHFEFKPQSLPPNGLNTAVGLPLDFDSDGDMDLFVGSRSVPGKYGVPGQSYLYQNDGAGQFKDVTRTIAPDLGDIKIGMITDAIFADVMGDSAKELILTQEWGSPVVLEIKNGKFSRLKTDLDNYSGWWYAAKAADLDNDGDQDLILGNRGENFYFTGSPEAPAKLWISDFDANKTIEKIITRNVDGKDMPVPLKKELTGQIVSLKKQNLKHTDFAKKAIQDLFAPEVLKKALVREGNWFKSIIAINLGDGKFEIRALPQEVQFSCVCDIYCQDLNGDEKIDLVMAGNDAGFTPQFSKLDASFGHVLINQGDGQFKRIESGESGLFLKGEVRQLMEINMNGQRHLLVGINNDQPKLLKFN